jgi:Flp pilus assembly pilin Flp
MLQQISVRLATLVTRWRDDDRGQATAEYALVVVAAAAIAVALIVWASNTGTLASFFGAVMRRIRSYV